MNARGNITVEGSSFVTAVAWVFIALAGLGTLITAMQNIMLFTVFPLEEVRQLPADDPEVQAVPAWAKFAMRHFKLWFLFFFAVSAATLVSAVGLLRRLNWARLLFVGILIFGVIWNLGAPVLGLAMMRADRFGPEGGDVARMHLFMQAFTGVLALGMACLFGWIAWRLCSPTIRAEFQSSGGLAA
jgi:hypothetical protein